MFPPYHIETSQLIYFANQLTSFFMMGNIGRYCVKVILSCHSDNPLSSSHWKNTLPKLIIDTLAANSIDFVLVSL